MEFTNIPGITPAVSRVGLGTWAMGGWMWGGSDEEESIATIHAAFDHGINLVDTAPVYGFGRSEEIVGKELTHNGLRQRVVIATKVGLDWKDGQPFRDASRQRIVAEVEASLKRLRTDYIDPESGVKNSASGWSNPRHAELARSSGHCVKGYLKGRVRRKEPTSLCSLWDLGF